MEKKKVAIMFSGGKDSCQAVVYALRQGWDVKALIAVKPKSTEAYLYHYPMVEWTRLSAEALRIPLILINSKEIGPEKEAKELEETFSKLNVDAVLLGGVGLQKTQIREIRKIAEKYKMQVLIPYENYTSEQLLKEEINAGLDIVITDVAADGLGPEWIGKKLDKKTFLEFKKLSERFGFDILGEGGYFNTFVVNGPKFQKRIEFLDTAKIWDSKTESGYLEVKDAILVSK